MPRRPRVLLADYPLHIVQRGINREPCFFADEDYYCYLHWLEESARACGCAIEKWQKHNDFARFTWLISSNTTTHFERKSA